MSILTRDEILREIAVGHIRIDSYDPTAIGPVPAGAPRFRDRERWSDRSGHRA